MKLMKTATVTNWRNVFEESVQLDYAQIPNGQTYKETDEDGVEKTRSVTEEKLSLGFQTETGRGKGIQWVPVDHVGPVLERLTHYAENGVEREESVAQWLNPAEAIDETIAKVPRTDSNGNTVEGEYDIVFRTRQGKGSKSCHVPVEDFGEFVAMLRDAAQALPEAIEEIEATRAELPSDDETDDGTDED